MKSSAEESARYEEVFNLLPQYRFERNGKPDADGATRWRCPVCAGRLRFVNIQHKFFRVFGLAKMTLLLAFSLAGYNLEAIRSFTAKKEAERTAPPPKRTRKTRRIGTWTDLTGSDRPKSGRSPPPT